MALQGIRERALRTTDAMSSSMRECVHEFGLPIVQGCLDAGVSDPRRIRQLVATIWYGAREAGQSGGALNTVDWLLTQTGGIPNAKTLCRILHSSGYAIVPFEATREMLNASMNEVSGYNVRVSKEEKHRRRLRAALRVGMDQVMAGKR